MDSSSPFYRFLSYYRVLEVAIPEGKKRLQWIADRIPHLTESKASITRLGKSKVDDVGAWLYQEGRNALAHASGKGGGTVRDICDFDDWQDIVWGSEIVKELAWEVVIECLDVSRPSHA